MVWKYLEWNRLLMFVNDMSTTPAIDECLTSYVAGHTHIIQHIWSGVEHDRGHTC